MFSKQTVKANLERQIYFNISEWITAGQLTVSAGNVIHEKTLEKLPDLTEKGFSMGEDAFMDSSLLTDVIEDIQWNDINRSIICAKELSWAYNRLEGRAKETAESILMTLRLKDRGRPPLCTNMKSHNPKELHRLGHQLVDELALRCKMKVAVKARLLKHLKHLAPEINAKIPRRFYMATPREILETITPYVNDFMWKEFCNSDEL